MKKFIAVHKEKNYKWSNEYNDKNLYSIVELITDYDTLSILQQLNRSEGLTLNSMKYYIQNANVCIEPLYVDNPIEYQVILPLNTFKFIVAKWCKFKELNVDTIVISEENGQYSISAEFKVPYA